MERLRVTFILQLHDDVSCTTTTGSSPYTRGVTGVHNIAAQPDMSDDDEFAVSPDEFDITPTDRLVTACVRGDLVSAEAAVTEGASVNDKGPQAWRPPLVSSVLDACGSLT